MTEDDRQREVGACYLIRSLLCTAYLTLPALGRESCVPLGRGGCGHEDVSPDARRDLGGGGGGAAALPPGLPRRGQETEEERHGRRQEGQAVVVAVAVTKGAAAVAV